MKFIVIVWAAFLARVNPVSTMAKPACMNITRNPATSVHTKLMATVFAAAAAVAAWASESAAGTTGVIGSPEQGWNVALVSVNSCKICTIQLTCRYYLIGWAALV